jgi:hypothetical protein
MTNFPVSPILKKNLRTIQRGVEEAIVRLPQGDERAYVQYVTEAGERLRPETDFPIWFLFHMFLYSGFIRASVRFANHALFRFAPPGNAEYCESISRLKQSPFCTIEHTALISGKGLEVSGLVPSSIREISNHFLMREIVPFIDGYFAHSPVIVAGKGIDLYAVFKQELESLIKSATEVNQLVTITHLKFQEMFIFFELLGKFRSKEIIAEIIENIRTHLKRIDAIFVLSPFSYLIVSPGADEDLIQKRFQGIYFQSSSIVMDYQISTRTIREEAWSTEDLWKELGI